MIVKLIESEKITLANHLAERSTQRIVESASFAPFDKRPSDEVQESEFKFFKKCLDETDDY